ncbi:MAG TPA: isoaspartyl peptidase/L-asparaginase [Saprospiraceae bacterium]|nr:isoaspartyl peptidase/L-asparaginase [Lewinellaceae bacterium]HRX29083.1 isoaspartyl peptidase/L-asparaginase [Saprospiraceae bacterium]
MKNQFAIALHGGAGTLVKGMMTEEKEHQYKQALKEALDAGIEVLSKGGSALDAVETTVRVLEDCPLFNAGRGSVFTADGLHEMDASIMDGRNKEAGAVSLVQHIKNPISLAKAVMLHSGHVFLAGKGAEQFAKEQGLEECGDEYFYDEFRYLQWQEIKDSDSFQLDHSKSKDFKFGTVGCVALDGEGNLAAATSTGGMTNKKFGRVGDSPMIGAGTYANNETCAVSCTGSGEYFIRGVVAYDVSALMEFGRKSLIEAADEVIQKRVLSIGGDGGLIAVDANGNIAMPFNTEGMYRACRYMDGSTEIEIYR